MHAERAGPRPPCARAGRSSRSREVTLREHYADGRTTRAGARPCRTVISSGLFAAGARPALEVRGAAK